MMYWLEWYGSDTPPCSKCFVHKATAWYTVSLLAVVGKAGAHECPIKDVLRPFRDREEITRDLREITVNKVIRVCGCVCISYFPSIRLGCLWLNFKK